MNDEQVLGLLFELATAFGRMHGRLLAELSEIEALDGGSADNLLRREEGIIDALRDQTDPQAILLLEAMIRAASEPVEKTFAALNNGRQPPGGPSP